MMDSWSAKLKKAAGGASTTFSRAVQFTEEKLGTAEKTEYDANFENLLQRSDKTKQWTEELVGQTDCLIQPNPNQRYEDKLYEKLDRKKKDRITQYEVLGNAMVEAGNEFGPGTSYGNALVKCGQAQIQIGNAERDFVCSTANNFIQPLTNFLEGDMKTILKEKKILESKRLDLDSCKNRLRKAKSANAQSQAEADLRVAQSEFDRQAEITKILLEGINSTHAHHLRCLTDFVEAQQTFFAQCQQYMGDLQRQMGSFLPDPDSLVSNSNSLKTPNNHNSAPSIEVTAATPSVPEKRQAKVLYDYDAADSSELSLLADELIMVYNVPGSNSSEWLMAERGSQRGKVPVTHILKIL